MPILQIFTSYLQWGCNIARNILGTDNSLRPQECSYSQWPTAGLSSSCTTYTCSQWLWGILYSLLVFLTVTYTVKVYVKCFEQNTIMWIKWITNSKVNSTMSHFVYLMIMICHKYCFFKYHYFIWILWTFCFRVPWHWNYSFITLKICNNKHQQISWN